MYSSGRKLLKECQDSAGLHIMHRLHITMIWNIHIFRRNFFRKVCGGVQSSTAIHSICADWYFRNSQIWIPLVNNFEVFSLGGSGIKFAQCAVNFWLANSLSLFAKSKKAVTKYSCWAIPLFGINPSATGVRGHVVETCTKLSLVLEEFSPHSAENKIAILLKFCLQSRTLHTVLYTSTII